MLRLIILGIFTNDMRFSMFAYMRPIHGSKTIIQRLNRNDEFVNTYLVPLISINSLVFCRHHHITLVFHLTEFKLENDTGRQKDRLKIYK